MSSQSLFYHVHEARRRTAGRTDDFSDWLERARSGCALVAKLRAIDFYFLNLNQLRTEIIEHLPPVPVRAAHDGGAGQRGSR